MPATSIQINITFSLKLPLQNAKPSPSHFSFALGFLHTITLLTQWWSCKPRDDNIHELCQVEIFQSSYINLSAFFKVH